MKILAIRGKNLASLAHEFVLDFEKEPLAQAGLFAITGHTGAGKSTLLDALCLALYDKTPRLKNHRTERIKDREEASISATDTRTVLRRGSAEGFAEVDFLGFDDGRYRARWEVRRAHNKPQGNLQAVVMTCTCMKSLRALGHTKTEVLAEIQSKLGLTFEQFTRAVLLAQNDFSAFLKADESDRAELLETLTGTEIYSELSIKAHKRAAEESVKLMHIIDRLEALNPLSAAELLQLQEQRESLKSSLEIFESRKDFLKNALLWHATYAKLVTLASEATANRECATAALNNSENSFSLLEKVERVQPARALNSALFAARQEESDAHIRASQANVELQKAQLVDTQANVNLDSAHAAAVQAESKSAALAPVIVAARALDSEIKAHTTQHDESAKRRQHAERGAQQAQLALTAKMQEQNDTKNLQALVDAWLCANTRLKPVAQAWPLTEDAFARARTLQSQRAELRAAFKQTDKEHAKATADFEEVVRHLSDAQSSMLALEDRFAALKEACLAFDPTRLEQQRLACEAQRDQTLRLSHLWSALQDKQLQHASRAQRMEARDLLRVENEAIRDTAKANRPGSERALQAAERMLSLALQACAANVEALRANLTPDTPCSVCGSLEHPYVVSSPDSAAMLSVQEKEVARLRHDLALLISDENAALGLLAQLSKDHASDLRAHESAARQLDLELSTWISEANASFPELTTMPGQERSSWLLSSSQLTCAQLATLNSKLAQLAELRTRHDVALAALEDARKVTSGLTARKNLCSEQVANTNQARVSIVEQGNSIALQLEAILASLDATLEPASLEAASLKSASWRHAWQSDPNAFETSLRLSVGEWNAKSLAAEQAKARLLVLTAERDNLVLQEAQAAAALTQAQDDFAKLDTLLADLSCQRKALLMGQSADTVESQIELELKSAKAAYEKAKTPHTLAREHKVRCEEILAQANVHAQNTQTTHLRAQAALTQWLSDYNAAQSAVHKHPLNASQSIALQEALTFDGLQDLLRYETTWIRQERENLQRLESDLAHALTLEREREGHRREHQGLRTDIRDTAELTTDLETLETQRAGLSESYSETTGRLKQDERQREEATLMKAALEQQQELSSLWHQLDDLMGSASGTKFRQFAQQLTLEHLLVHANEHLKTLARRYQLDKVPGSGLGLQVMDLDMANEVRSVHSLSGGESFLVSLALALGLASLSSDRIRVDSLFIDEGFGSLDGETLQTAMDALDNLQSLGRKVGVISHVQEMTERIATRVVVKRGSGGQSRVHVWSV